MTGTMLIMPIAGFLLGTGLYLYTKFILARGKNGDKPANGTPAPNHG